MKSKVLLGLGVCLSLFLTSCKEDEPVNPSPLQVTMQSSSQTLVEGGDVLEVTVELDRTYDEIKYLYLDYGASAGEHPNFFERTLRQDSIQVKVQGEDRPVLRIPFLAGEQKKVISLQAVENDLYRGNRPLELKVLGYEQGYVQHKAEIKLNFEEKTPKPVFGIPADFAAKTLVISSKDHNTLLILPITVSGLFQFPQTVKLAFSGSAKMGTDYAAREATIELQPNTIYPIVTSHYGFLDIHNHRDFSTPKTIQITLVDAEEGEIANGQEFEYHGGETLMLHDTFTLTITE